MRDTVLETADALVLVTVVGMVDTAVDDKKGKNVDREVEGPTLNTVDRRVLNVLLGCTELGGVGLDTIVLVVILGLLVDTIVLAVIAGVLDCTVLDEIVDLVDSMVLDVVVGLLDRNEGLDGTVLDGIEGLVDATALDVMV